MTLRFSARKSFLMYAILILFSFHEHLSTCNSLSIQQEELIYSPEHHEKPIVVIIPSYNNAPWTRTTLDSVFSQKYQNFRVVYIDDCSTDGTGRLVANYIEKKNLHKITLIRNKKRCLKLKNIYNAIHSCNDRDIIVQLDGDDWWAHDHVLSDINTTYSTSDIWLTYGQYRNVPAEEAKKWGVNEKGYSIPTPDRIIKSRNFRKYHWIYMQQRTFYAWLFKLIKLEDFIAQNIQGFSGKFYPASDDVAMMYPMLEMAHWRFAFLPDVAYIRNIFSPIVTFKIAKSVQKQAVKEIKKKPIYPIVHEPVVGRINALENAQADLVIISSYNPSGLKELLISIRHNVSGTGSIHILYDASKKEHKNLYKQLKEIYPNINYHHFERAQQLTNILASSQNKFVLLCNDQLRFTRKTDLNQCIKLLEQTFAYGFYLNLGYHKSSFYGENKKSARYTPCQHIRDNIYAWKFMLTKRGNSAFNNFNMTLHRKKDIAAQLRSLSTHTLHDLIEKWQNTNVKSYKVGLFFKYPKAE